MIREKEKEDGSNDKDLFHSQVVRICRLSIR